MPTLLHSKSQCKSGNSKEVWVRYLCWSWRASQRGRKQQGTCAKDTDAGSINLGELIPPRGHGCWPALFWGPPWNPSEPGVYLPTRGLVSVSGLPGPHSQPSWDPAPPTGEPDATPWGRTTYATGGGPAPLQHPHCSQAHQTEGPTPHTGVTLGAFNSWVSS